MLYLNEIRAFIAFSAYIKNYKELEFNESEYQLKRWEKEQAEQVQRKKISKNKDKSRKK